MSPTVAFDPQSFRSGAVFHQPIPQRNQHGARREGELCGKSVIVGGSHPASLAAVGGAVGTPCLES